MPTFARTLATLTRLTVLACLIAPMTGCALVQRKAVGMVASTLASSGDVFTRDDDLELVGAAIPFGLKLYESLLDSAPKNKDLLIATCSNFTQYGVAYLETEAAVLGEAQHHDEVAHLNQRALHEMFISLDSLPDALGGDPERARKHFARAVELQKGLSPGPYVALATGVAVPAQDRAEFEKLLQTALAIDPEKDPSVRLVTLVQQRRARALLDHIDTMFTK